MSHHSHAHGEDNQECFCDTLPNEPVRSEADEALDEARGNVRIARRSMLAGLGLAAGMPLLAACSYDPVVAPSARDLPPLAGPGLTADEADMLLAVADEAARSRSSGQGGLFGGDDHAAPALRLTEVEAWSKTEQMARERENFGFYFAAHPVEQWRRERSKMMTADRRPDLL